VAPQKDLAGGSSTVTYLVRMEVGARLGAHPHGAVERCFVVAGDLHVAGCHLHTGDYHRAAQHSIHETTTNEGSFS
jgi:anti-sigma factor ChrR (cupin superfamily)